MGSCKKGSNSKRIRPALSPEARENQLIALAVAQAEKQLMEGTASSQIICHYLKLGSTRAQLENEKLKEENRLLRAKSEAITSGEDAKKKYEEAIAAMMKYGGHSSEEY